VRRRERCVGSRASLATLLIAAATALAASSAVRDQARSWLRAVGISSSVSERAGKAPVVSLASAGLGARLSTADAAARLAMRALPQPFGLPDAVFSTTGAVTLVWGPRHGLPPSAVRGVGALLTIEQRTDATDPFLLGKVLSGASTVEFVPLPGADGDQAVWIAGAPHAVRTYDGSRIRFRQAANALLWRIGPRVYRLEGRFGRATALGAARRMIG
jgi:hypothetical protein